MKFEIPNKGNYGIMLLLIWFLLSLVLNISSLLGLIGSDWVKALDIEVFIKVTAILRVVLVTMAIFVIVKRVEIGKKVLLFVLMGIAILLVVENSLLYHIADSDLSMEAEQALRGFLNPSWNSEEINSALMFPFIARSMFFNMIWFVFVIGIIYSNKKWFKAKEKQP